MDLACTEQISVCIAKKDINIIKDSRVIKNLLQQEALYIPKCDYFEVVQDDIKPFMRKVVTTWMHEVCEEQMCEDQILPLAVNYMDRFLCECRIKKQQLQLLGATCLLIASKIRSTNCLPIELLCAYTDYSVTYEHIGSWELLVLSKLDWNVASVTGYDYIDQIIERCSWGAESNLLHRHAHTLVSISYTEPSLIQARPSKIAAACISSAVRGLKLASTDRATIDICNMLGINPTDLSTLARVIDSIVEKVVPRTPEPAPENKMIVGYESPVYGQPETPTEVDTVYF